MEKSKDLLRKNRLTLILAAICLPFLIYFIVFSRSESKLYNQLDKAGIIDTAVVVRDFLGAKRKLYFEYEFTVNGQRLNGFLQYSPSHGDVLIGDSILVKYLPSKPDDINQVMTYKDYRLIKLKK
jgi:hypothetical protein